MSSRDLILKEQLLCIFRKIEQPKRVRNSRTSFRYCLGNIRLSHLPTFHEATIPIGFFNRIQIRTLDILNERKFKRFIIINILDLDRNFLQPSQLRCLPTALTCDDLIIRILNLTHKDRLNEAFFLDGVGKFLQLGLFEVSTWLIRVRSDQFNLNFKDSLIRRFLFFLGFGFTWNIFDCFT